MRPRLAPQSMPISTGLNSSRIRVGIILRDDRQSSVVLQWTAGEVIASSVDLPRDVTMMTLCADDGLVEVRTSKGVQRERVVSLRVADDVSGLQAGDGIGVDPVRTGRGFHWQKDIGVTLPGEVSVGAHDSCLQMINTVDVESYVACVATSEMGADAPNELLAAQTIVARCWALALVEQKHRSEGFDVCNDDCCQRYQGTTYVSPHSVNAARDTAGEVLVYQDAVIDARYSKNCGGLVEDYTTVWDSEPVPYLVPLWDAPSSPGEPHFGHFAEYYNFGEAYCAPTRFAGVDLQGMLGKVDVSGDYYRWRKKLPEETLLRNLEAYHQAEWSSVDSVDIGERGASARISSLIVKGKDRDGKRSQIQIRGEYSIRRAFSESFLYSSAFEVLNLASLATDGVIELRGCGWGHGVGLCQMGALGMALNGRSVREIVEHYYPGAELRVLDRSD